MGLGLVVVLLLAGCGGAVSSPAPASVVEGAVEGAVETSLAAAFDGCEAWPAPEGGVILECAHRGVSLRIEPFDLDIATLRGEILVRTTELEEVAPLSELDATVPQLVVRLVAAPEMAAAGLVAVAEMPGGTLLSTCSPRFDAAGPFDEPWCRAAMHLLLEDGGRSLLPPLSTIDFVGRTLELAVEGCWADRPGTITCSDGAQLSWTTASAERVDELLRQSSESALIGMVGHGARRLDQQSPACRVDDAQASRCEVIRLASGREVIIAVFAAASLRERHVLVECSWAVDDAGPALDPWLPPICADILTVVP